MKYNNISVFYGSPRVKNSNTYLITSSFLKGIKNKAPDVNINEVFLIRKKIKPCYGCFDCWTRLDGKCITKDDMEDLIEIYKNSDLAIIATPLYADGMTGITKMFVDRLLPLLLPFFTEVDGEMRHKLRYERMPKLGIISNAGFYEDSHFQVLKHWIHRVAKNHHTEVVLEIYRGAGELLKSSNKLVKKVVDKYLMDLEKAGEEFITSGKLSEDTTKKLNRALIPKRLYITTGNMMWKRLIRNKKSYLET